MSQAHFFLVTACYVETQGLIMIYSKICMMASCIPDLKAYTWQWQPWKPWDLWWQLQSPLMSATGSNILAIGGRKGGHYIRTGGTPKGWLWWQYSRVCLVSMTKYLNILTSYISFPSFHCNKYTCAMCIHIHVHAFLVPKRQCHLFKKSDGWERPEIHYPITTLLQYWTFWTYFIVIITGSLQ